MHFQRKSLTFGNIKKQQYEACFFLKHLCLCVHELKRWINRFSGGFTVLGGQTSMVVISKPCEYGTTLTNIN